LSGDAVEINIIDDTSRRDCDINCGTDWSSEEAIVLANMQIRSRFGTEVRLEYIDLSRNIPNRQMENWQLAIREKGLAVPLLLINGHLRVAGQFDTRQIINAIETEMEMGT
jgi:disulfide oxidoreductase YuzD